MKKALLSIFLLAIISNYANAQGCVAIRQMGGLNPINSSGAMND